MANSRTTGGSGYYFEKASVDADPGAAGYGCNPVSNLAHSPGKQPGLKRFFIETLGTDAEVTLQWKYDTASTWTDYKTYTAVDRENIDDTTAGVSWKAIVKDGKQGSSGTSLFGIDW